MNGIKIHADIARDIWDILVKYCGAPNRCTPGRPSDQSVFANIASEHGISEYRFCGKLGFGGKVWANRGRACYVTCYSEDETPERLTMIEAANDALRDLWASEFMGAGI